MLAVGDDDGAIIVDGDFFVMTDGFRAVMTDTRGFVIFDNVVLIFLGMNIDLLLAFFIFEANFIEVSGGAVL